MEYKMTVTKKQMLTILEATEIKPNKGRVNILKPGQKPSLSMVLGKVRKLYSSCDGKVCKVESRHNKNHKALWRRPRVSSGPTTRPTSSRP